MSIFPSVIDAICAEDERQPISGDVLLIGRQRIEYSPKTDLQFFGEFAGVRSVRAIDASPFEGADIVWNLNDPIPDANARSCDFIFDGSCLDNIWDPAAALRSFSKMLRPGGRMVLVEHGTAIQGAILAFSPEWFFGFFAANDYERCAIMMYRFPNGIYGGEWIAMPWTAYIDGDPVSATPGTKIGDFITLVVAQKGAASTDDRAPVQAQYRQMHGSDDEKYRTAHRRFEQRA